MHDYHIAHRDDIRERKKRWWVKNGKQVVAHVQSTKYASARKSRENLKNAVINVLTNGEGTCRHCGQGDIDVLCIDHMDGGGLKHRAALRLLFPSILHWLVKNDYPAGYQVLCSNCNLKKEIVRRRGTVEPLPTFTARELAHNPKEYA